MTRAVTLRSAAYALVSRFVVRTRLIEGILRGSDRPFRCLYVGDSLFISYMLERLYTEPPAVLRSWRAWIPSVKTLVRTPPDKGIDLCVAVLPKAYDARFRSLCDFQTRETVGQALDVSGSWASVRGGFRGNPAEIERRIRKHALRARQTRHQRDFDFFFERMYLPHARKQFGSIATINTYDNLHGYFEKGFLLQVMEADSPVAAALCYTEGETLVQRRMGVLDGDRDLIRKGVQAAAYYFTIRHANDEGLRAVDFTVSQPFFNDGVYDHKRSWGAGVYRDPEADRGVYFFHIGQRETVSRFYALNPIVVHANGRLWGAVGLPDGQQRTPERDRQLTNRFVAPGLDGLILLTPQSEAREALRFHAPPGGGPGAEDH